MTELKTPEDLKDAYNALGSFLGAFNQVSHNFLDASSLLLELLSKSIGGVYSVFYKYNSDNEALEAFESFACNIGDLPKKVFTIGEGIPGQVAKMKNIHEVDGVENNYVINNSISQSTFSLTLFPVLGGVKLIGVIEIATLNPLSEIQKDVLTKCISYAGVQLASLQIEDKKNEIIVAQEKEWQQIEAEKEELKMQKEAVRFNFERLQLLETFEKKNQELEQQISLLRAHNSESGFTVQSQNKELEARLLATENQLADSKNQLEVQKRDAEVKIQQLEAQLKENPASISIEADNERVKLLEQEIAKLENTLNAVKQEYETKLAEKETEVFSEQSPVQQETEFAQRIQSLKEKYEVQREEDSAKLAESQRRVQELTEALRTSGDTENVVAIKQQLVETQTKLNQLETEYNMIKVQEKPVISDNNELIATYEAKLEAFSEKVKEYREQITQAHNDEINDYEQKIKTKNSEIRKLKKSLSEKSQSNDSVSDEINMLKKEIDDLKQSLRNKDEKIEELSRTSTKQAELGYQVEREELMEYEHKLSSALQLAQEYKVQLEEANQTVEMLKRQIK